jgi:hypothetical protein
MRRRDVRPDLFEELAKTLQSEGYVKEKGIRLVCSICSRTVDRIAGGRYSMIGSLCRPCRDEIMRELDPHPVADKRRTPGLAA